MIFTQHDNLIKKLFIGSSALLILSSLGITNLPNNVNAKVHHNHTHRIYHHYKKRFKHSKKHMPKPKAIIAPHYLSANQIKTFIQHTYILSLQKGTHNKQVKSNVNLINKSILKDINNMTIEQAQSLKSTPDLYMLNISWIAKRAISNRVKANNKIIEQQINDNYSKDTNQVWNSRGNNAYAKEVAKYIYQYINQAREQYGLKPLKLDRDVQEIANLRSKQYTHDMESYATDNMENDMSNGDMASGDALAHGKDFHDSANDDAQKLGILDRGFGENCGPINTGYLYNPSDNFGDAGHYEHNDNPKEVAYNDINTMLNYDKFTGNGHRYNILNPTATVIGISVYYHSNKVSRPNTDYAPSNGGIVQEFD